MIISGIVVGCIFIVALAIHIKFESEEGKTLLSDPIEVIGCPFIFSALIFGIAMIPCFIVQSRTVEVEEYVMREERIYSLETSSKIDGSFVLGSGTINQKFIYVFYKKNTDGSYHLDYIDASNVDIVESDTTEPCIQYINYKVVNPDWWYKVGTHVPTKYKTKRLVVVPVGTIRQVYNGNIGG